MKELDGQVAIITGAARGIGRGIAEILAEEGASIAIADLDRGAAEATAGDLKQAGREAIAVAVDVTDEASLELMASRVLEELGRIDILAANAGIYPTALIDELDPTEWD